jgi:exonuclease III
LTYRTNEWDKDFRSYAKELNKKKPLIIAGDLNVAHKDIDLYSPKTLMKTPCFTNEEREGLNKLINELNVVDTFREQHPTLVIN